MGKAIVTYCWPGNRDYAPWQVNVLARLCEIHAPEHRFICVTDGFNKSEFSARITVVETPRHVIDVSLRESPEGGGFPSSYRRLWTFSDEFADIVGRGTLTMLLDVDCIPCGHMAPLFDRPENFVGWRPASRWGEPDRLAGGTWLHRLGTLPHVWDYFYRDPYSAVLLARSAGYRGSDQALLSHLLAKSVAVWEEPHGIYQSQNYTVFRRNDRMPSKYRSFRKGSKGKTLTVDEARQLRALRKDYQWTVPEDARILHFNGHTKPWHSSADFVQRLWVPYAMEEPGYREYLRRRSA